MAAKPWRSAVCAVRVGPPVRILAPPLSPSIRMSPPHNQTLGLAQTLSQRICWWVGTAASSCVTLGLLGPWHLWTTVASRTTWRRGGIERRSCCLGGCLFLTLNRLSPSLPTLLHPEPCEVVVAAWVRCASPFGQCRPDANHSWGLPLRFSVVWNVFFCVPVRWTTRLRSMFGPLVASWRS
jgi:hypothetical protein